MIDSVATEVPATDAPARRRRRWWIVAAVVVLVLAVGGVVADRLVSRYADATPLECACGLVWSPPDNSHTTDSEAGAYRAANVPADPSRRQSFLVEIVNSSPVTQTILGDADAQAARQTIYRPELTISVGDPEHDDGLPTRFTGAAVAIPPGGERWLRYAVTAACLDPGAKLIYDSVSLRVRVGWFTRTETVDFDRSSFVLVGTAASRCR